MLADSGEEEEFGAGRGAVEATPLMEERRRGRPSRGGRGSAGEPTDGKYWGMGLGLTVGLVAAVVAVWSLHMLVRSVPSSEVSGDKPVGVSRSAESLPSRASADRASAAREKSGDPAAALSGNAADAAAQAASPIPAPRYQGFPVGSAAAPGKDTPPSSGAPSGAPPSSGAGAPGDASLAGGGRAPAQNADRATAADHAGTQSREQGRAAVVTTGAAGGGRKQGTSEPTSAAGATPQRRSTSISNDAGEQKWSAAAKGRRYKSSAAKESPLCCNKVKVC